jgi:hypothetical protein
VIICETYYASTILSGHLEFIASGQILSYGSQAPRAEDDGRQCRVHECVFAILALESEPSESWYRIVNDRLEPKPEQPLWSVGRRQADVRSWIVDDNATQAQDIDH